MGEWLTELRRNLPSDVVLHVVGTKADIVARDPSLRQVPFERCIAYVAKTWPPALVARHPRPPRPSMDNRISLRAALNPGAQALSGAPASGAKRLAGTPVTRSALKVARALRRSSALLPGSSLSRIARCSKHFSKQRPLPIHQGLNPVRTEDTLMPAMAGGVSA